MLQSETARPTDQLSDHPHCLLTRDIFADFCRYVKVNNTSPCTLWNVLETTCYCVTIIRALCRIHSIWLIRVNDLLFPEDSCRCSPQHVAGRSVEAAEARCHTWAATTSQCSGLRACRGCCYTHWCLSHTDGPRTLKWGCRQCFQMMIMYTIDSINYILCRLRNRVIMSTADSAWFLWMSI